MYKITIQQFVDFLELELFDDLFNIEIYSCQLQLLVDNNLLFENGQQGEIQMIINNKNFIKYLKNKDEKALNYIIDTYGGLIKSVINKHLYNMKDYHEECIQDVFLDIWKGIDKYDSNKGDFKNWIAAIAKYKCIMYKRKYSTTSLNQDIGKPELGIDNIEIEIKNKELKEEVDNLLGNLLGNLKEEDRRIFIEYYIEEKTIKEISQDLNIKDDNIYNRISRGKRKLRILFKNKNQRGQI